MTNKQGEAEIEYRLSVMLLEELLQDGLITNEELLKLKKKLVRKYKPVIGCLEVKL